MWHKFLNEKCGGQDYIFNKLQQLVQAPEWQSCRSDPRPGISEQIHHSFRKAWISCNTDQCYLILNFHANASFSKMNVLLISEHFKLGLFEIIIFRINERSKFLPNKFALLVSEMKQQSKRIRLTSMNYDFPTENNLRKISFMYLKFTNSIDLRKNHVVVIQSFWNYIQHILPL